MENDIDAEILDLGLLHAENSESFDKLTRLASAMIGAPVALASIVMPKQDR